VAIGRRYRARARESCVIATMNIAGMARVIAIVALEVASTVDQFRLGPRRSLRGGSKRRHHASKPAVSMRRPHHVALVEWY
jgi:hypothetical protein